MRGAEALYDAGCDTIPKLHFKKYKRMLSPRAKMGLKYINHSRPPVPRENAEAIMVRCYFPHSLGSQAQADRRTQEFCKHFIPMDGYEVIIAGD